MASPFLSEAWIAAAREIRTRYEEQTPPIPASVRANLNISEVPFGEGVLQAHLDTSSGRMEMDLGHLDAADATLTMDYATARSFVVDQDQTAIMQAVMAGKVRIQGDLTKLMAMASLGQSSGAAAGSEAAALAGRIAQEIKDITADPLLPVAPPAAPSAAAATTPPATPPPDPTPADTTPADTTPADTTPADTTPPDDTPATADTPTSSPPGEVSPSDGSARDIPAGDDAANEVPAKDAPVADAPVAVSAPEPASAAEAPAQPTGDGTPRTADERGGGAPGG